MMGGLSSFLFICSSWEGLWQLAWALGQGMT